jgi:hypothetical protein
MYAQYEGHRIYVLQLRNALWAASIMRLTMLQQDNRTSPGDVVDGIGGEYTSRDQAIMAAKQFIDEHPEKNPRSTLQIGRPPSA